MTITEEGKSFELDASMVEIVKEKRKLSGRNITPSVIEPSFGIGRIVYSLFEHAFYVREVRRQHVFSRCDRLLGR